MKIRNVNNKKVLEHDFQSMNEFLDYILTQPINTEVFHPSMLESARTDFNFVKFSKTKTFEEAVNLCRFGYFENFDKFYRDKVMLQPRFTNDGIGSRLSNDYVGFYPDIKAFMDGNPLNMVNNVLIPKGKISIYYCVGISGASNEKVMYNRGVITLNIIEYFERMGYSVDLNFFDLTNDSYFIQKQYLLIKFVLKKVSERVNPQLLYFPMCHPAFSRRLVFRLIEQTPHLSQYYSDSYGYHCTLDEMQEIIGADDKTIIIGWAQDMKIEGEDLIDDAEAMLKVIGERNLQKTLKLPKIIR